MNASPETRLNRASRVAWGIGTAGSAVCLLGLLVAGPRVWQAYWIAWLFWSGLGFGSLIILMLHALSGGAWGEAVRAPAEAGARTLSLAAALFVPALFHLGDIFPWVQLAPFTSPSAPHKHAYLTVPWFAVRGLGYFAVLIAVTILLGLWRQSSGGRVRFPGWPAGKTAVSAGGLIAYFALMLFASTDWVVSLEPHWVSTMFVVIFAVDHFLGALAGAVVVILFLPFMHAPLTVKQLHDLGNLLLAFVIFWAYVTFSQFLIIWSGNLPREISWYLHRSAGGWPRVTVVLVMIQFAVPFALLLSRAAKRRPRFLGPIALIILGASGVHTWWLIAPSFQTEGMRAPYYELAAFAGLGGLWCGVFLRFLRQRISAPEGLFTEVPHV